MKKILFIVWSFSMGGGVEKVLSEMMNKIDTTKYEVSVLEFHNFDIKIESIPEEIKLLKPVVIQYSGSNKTRKLLNKLKIKSAAFGAKYFPSIMRKKYISDKYDVEIAFNYMLPTFLLSKDNDIKKIAWIHGEILDLDYKSYNSFMKRAKFKENYRLQKLAFENVDSIVSISKRTYNSVIKIYPEMKEKSTIVYNGFDFDKIKDLSLKKVNLNIEDDKNAPIILSLGRLDQNKNQKLLIDAITILKKRKCKFKTIVIGKGEDEAFLKDYAKNQGVEDCIIWQGYEGNPYPFIKKADILAITSYYEGFPTVAIEALSLKTDLVTTDVAGIDEITDNYKYCMISKNEPEEYAKKLEEVLKRLESEEHEKLIEDAAKYVGRFTIENQVSELYNMIER